MFDVKFPCVTQLTFGSLIFATEENRELKMLPPGPALGHLAPTSSSASGRSCVGPGHYAGSYIRTAKIIQGIPVVTSTLRILVGASGSSTSASTPNSDSADDYPEIGQAIPPVDIPPSEDQRHPMPEHRVVAWLRT
jgi:hypothetical protein